MKSLSRCRMYFCDHFVDQHLHPELYNSNICNLLFYPPNFLAMVLNTRLNDHPLALDDMKMFMSRSVYYVKYRRRDMLRFAAQYHRHFRVHNNFRGLNLHPDTDELQSQSSGHGSLPQTDHFSLFQVRGILLEHTISVTHSNLTYYLTIF